MMTREAYTARSVELKVVQRIDLLLQSNSQTKKYLLVHFTRHERYFRTPLTIHWTLADTNQTRCKNRWILKQ